MAIRILLADDHALLRQGIKRVLNFEDDLEVVGEAEDGQEALARTLMLKPARYQYAGADGAGRDEAAEAGARTREDHRAHDPRQR